MGQQQLLLIVLGVILVGVAVVLGIQYFGVGAEEGAKDELVAHSQIISSNAQQWLKKPVSMGGGGGVFNPTGYTAYTIPDRMLSSTNGDYSLTSATDTTAVILAEPKDNTGYTWTITTTVGPNSVGVVISN